MNTNQNIYYALRQVIEEGDLHPTDSVDKRVAELFMFDFEQSGIHLPDDKVRKRISFLWFKSYSLISLMRFFRLLSVKNLVIEISAKH